MSNLRSKNWVTVLPVAYLMSYSGQAPEDHTGLEGKSQGLLENFQPDFESSYPEDPVVGCQKIEKHLWLSLNHTISGHIWSF
jgi:hypothetical protein